MKIILVLLLIAGVAATSRYDVRLNYYHAPFLANTTKESRDEYKAIITNSKLSEVQEQEKIAAWAKKYKRTDELKKFNAKLDESMKLLNENGPQIDCSLASHL
ncbi:hypothetical protein OSTOST_07716 [Ostertagia ostertagi]